MGAYAYLQLRPKRSLIKPIVVERTLFSRKTEVPFAWYLLFGPEDFEAKTGLAADVSAALKRARRRLEALRPHATEELAEVLERFLERLSKEKPSARFVLNADELRFSKSELTAPARWFASLEEKKLTRALVKKGERFFEDGVFWLDDDDEDDVWLDVDEEADLAIGWPSDTKDQELLGKKAVTPEPPPRAKSVELEQLLAAVRERPSELAPRLVYADALTAAGDPRGEFITLACQPSLGRKPARRLSDLRAQLLPELVAPFAPARVTFTNGFAAEATFEGPPTGPIPNPEAWKTIHTLVFRGGAAVLADPAFQSARRVYLHGADLLTAVELRSRVPFQSIVLLAEPSISAWHALRMTEYFPFVLEVCVGGFSVWLPDGARQLVESRPEIHLRKRSLDLDKLAPLTPEEQRARRAQWDAPARGAQLPGARYDDQYLQ